MTAIQMRALLGLVAIANPSADFCMIAKGCGAASAEFDTLDMNLIIITMPDGSSLYFDVMENRQD